MASKSARRRQARERGLSSPTSDATVTKAAGAVVHVAKATRQPRSGGDADYDRALQPLVPFEQFLTLKDENAVHSACIEAKVADSVGRGWMLEQEDDTEADGEAGEVEDDADRITRQLTDKLRALTTGAGSRLSFRELVKQAMREMDACGHGAIEVSRARLGGEIDGLYPLPAQTLRKVKGYDDPDKPEHGLFVQLAGDKKTYFKSFGDERSISARLGTLDAESPEDEANEVILFEHYSGTSAHYGMPPWISVVPTIAELAAIRGYNMEWFGSGGTGDRVIHVSDDGGNGETIATKILEKLDEARGKGHTTVVSWGGEQSKVDVHFMSQKEGERDSQFRGGKADLIAELLIGHTMPPYRVGQAVAGDLGGNAAREMLDSYRDGVVDPLKEYAEDVLAASIFNPEKGGLPIPGYQFRFVARDWSDMEADLARAEKSVELALATRNEGREMIGLAVVDDPLMDEFYYHGQPVQTQATGVDALAELRAALEAVLRDQERAAPGADGDLRDTNDEDAPQDPSALDDTE